jgi:hypothetical protein
VGQAIISVVLALPVESGWTQGGGEQQGRTTESSPAAIRAVRIAEPIVMDGLLDEERWMRAEPVTKDCCGRSESE